MEPDSEAFVGGKKGMNTCKDCKWWDKPNDGELMGWCDITSLFVAEESADGMLSTESEYGLPVKVGPDFGCIKWEAKDENLPDA